MEEKNMYNYYEQSYPNIGTFYHLDIGTVSDEEYDKLKPIIEHLGGHWREKFKCFVFGEDVRDKIEETIAKKQEKFKPHESIFKRALNFIVNMFKNLSPFAYERGQILTSS